MHVLRYQQIFQHRHFFKKANILEGSRQARSVHEVSSTKHFVPEARAELAWFDEVVELKRLAEDLDEVQSV